MAANREKAAAYAPIRRSACALETGVSGMAPEPEN
jgi:hypothetical protein